MDAVDLVGFVLVVALSSGISLLFSARVMAKLNRDAGRPTLAEAWRKTSALSREHGIGWRPYAVVGVVGVALGYGLVVLAQHG